MDTPVMPEPRWQVFTSSEIHKGVMLPQWAWVAYGPRGSQSGVEAKAEDAVYKAQAASVVLADPRTQRTVAA